MAKSSQNKRNKIGRQPVGLTGANIQLFSKNGLSAFSTVLETLSTPGRPTPCSHGARFHSSLHHSTHVLSTSRALL